MRRLSSILLLLSVTALGSGAVRYLHELEHLAADARARAAHGHGDADHAHGHRDGAARHVHPDARADHAHADADGDADHAHGHAHHGADHRTAAADDAGEHGTTGTHRADAAHHEHGDPAGGHPHPRHGPAHGPADCFVHAQLNLPLHDAGHVPVLVCVGRFVAFPDVPPAPAVRSRRPAVTLDSRGPPAAPSLPFHLVG